MGVGAFRRHYRNKVLAREFAGEDATAMVYQAKADAIAGFALPRRFVSDKIQAKLVELNLTTLDDLNGATTAEIADRTGLSEQDAGKVRAAVEREVALRAEDKVKILEDFPFHAALTAAGYSTEESLVDRHKDELADIEGVGAPGARVITAYQGGLLKIRLPVPDLPGQTGHTGAEPAGDIHVRQAG